MENCRFSKEADKDIDKIYEYTILNFGHKKAKVYLQNLNSKIQSITNQQVQGRKVDFIREDLRRLEVGSHIIFYTKESALFLIVRVLHKNMDAERHI